jgi:ketosteroid isomerase-like protein
VPETVNHRLEIAQRFLLNLGHPDIERAINDLSPQVVYRVPGTHSMAGTFNGREAVARHLTELVDRTAGTFDAVKWDDWLLGEFHVAGVAQIHVQNRGGLYSGRAMFVARFDAADLIASFEVFVEDEQAFSQFFGP